MKYTRQQAETIAYIKTANHVLSQKLGCKSGGRVKDEIERIRSRDNKDSKDYYPCIEFNYYKTLDKIFSTVKENIDGTISFLDVGCGMGNVMYYIQRKHSPYTQLKRIDGIEREEIYHTVFEEEMSQYFYYMTKVNFHNIDAFAFDNYDRYDLIYMYVPIRHSKKMMELHKLITKKAKNGAYIADVGTSLQSHKDVELESVPNAPYLYKKIS